MIDLTTVSHLQAWLALDSNPAAAGPNVQMQLAQVVSDVSQQLSEYCDNDFLISQVVERYSMEYNQRTVVLKQRPVRSIVSVGYDATGAFMPGVASFLQEGSDFALDPDGSRLNFYVQWPSWQNSRCLEITYSGGIVGDTIQTKYNATATGAVATGVQETTDGRKINILSFTDGVLTFLPQIGAFRQGQQFTIGSTMITMGTVVSPSVVNDYPMLEQACLIQAREEWTRRTSMGKSATTMGQGDTRYTGEYRLLDAVLQKLIRFRRINIGF